MTLRFGEETVSAVRLLDVVDRDVLAEDGPRLGIVLIDDAPVRSMNEAFGSYGRHDCAGWRCSCTDFMCFQGYLVSSGSRFGTSCNACVIHPFLSVV